MSFVVYIPILYLPFYVRNQGKKSITDSDDLHFARHCLHLALWLTCILPLFSINYLLSALRVYGTAETIAIYQIISVLTKGLYAAVTMDSHYKRLQEIRTIVIEEQRANEARRSFLKYIFHEVRTPLHSLSMGVAFLNRSESINADDRESLAMMKSSIDFMSETLNNVLSIQKIEEGQLQLDLGPFRFQDVLLKVISTMKAGAIAKGIEILTEIGEDVPDIVVGDRYRVEHVICNLMSNAIKFSPPNHPIKLAIRLLSTPIDTSIAIIKVSVADEGPGISSEGQAKLFNNFVQIRPGHLQEGQGSGLGLALCKQIVTLHGGSIGVNSIEGVGSVFHFTIPFDVYRGLNSGFGEPFTFSTPQVYDIESPEPQIIQDDVGCPQPRVLIVDGAN